MIENNRIDRMLLAGMSNRNLLAILLWLSALILPGSTILLMVFLENYYPSILLPDLALLVSPCIAAGLTLFAAVLSSLSWPKKIGLLLISPVLLGGSFLTGLFGSFFITGMPVD